VELAIQKLRPLDEQVDRSGHGLKLGTEQTINSQSSSFSLLPSGNLTICELKAMAHLVR